MKKTKQIAILAVCAAMMLTACGGGSKNEGTGDADLSKYPIETDVTLSYFRALPSTVMGQVENYGETAYSQELEKRTGVKFEYMHPSAGQIQQTLNLMVASDELPDIIEYAWTFDYVGGPAKAIFDEVIVPLNDYKEYAPGLFKLLEENPDYDKAIKTDNGEYYGFPMINDGEKLALTSGPVIRQDWLDSLGLEIPETLTEWETVLTAFKEKKGATAPLSFDYSNTSYFWGVLNASKDTYIKDGKIVFGAVQPEFKEALTIANDWFNKGLLDNNIASVDSKMAGSQLVTGATGITFLSGGSGISKYLPSGKENDPAFDIVGIKYPTKVKGENATWAPAGLPISGAATAAISTSCEYPAIAAKALDYIFTDEGHLFMNFGIEGKTYEMKDGIPTYTEMITNNPNGLSFAQALGMYVKAGASNSGMISEHYIEQYYTLPQQKAALTAWTSAVAGSLEKRVPLVTPSDDELTEYANIMNEINTYRDQMIIKFITGIEPMDKFEEYVDRINGYGLEKAMEIQNKALQRYNKR